MPLLGGVQTHIYIVSTVKYSRIKKRTICKLNVSILTVVISWPIGVLCTNQIPFLGFSLLYLKMTLYIAKVQFTFKSKSKTKKKKIIDMRNVVFS